MMSGSRGSTICMRVCVCLVSSLGSLCLSNTQYILRQRRQGYLSFRMNSIGVWHPLVGLMRKGSETCVLVPHFGPYFRFVTLSL